MLAGCGRPHQAMAVEAPSRAKIAVRCALCVTSPGVGRGRGRRPVCGRSSARMGPCLRPSASPPSLVLRLGFSVQSGRVATAPAAGRCRSCPPPPRGHEAQIALERRQNHRRLTELRNEYPVRAVRAVRRVCSSMASFSKSSRSCSSSSSFACTPPHRRREKPPNVHRARGNTTAAPCGHGVQR